MESEATKLFDQLIRWAVKVTYCDIKPKINGYLYRNEFNECQDVSTYFQDADVLILVSESENNRNLNRISNIFLRKASEIFKGKVKLFPANELPGLNKHKKYY